MPSFFLLAHGQLTRGVDVVERAIALGSRLLLLGLPAPLQGDGMVALCDRAGTIRERCSVRPAEENVFLGGTWRSSRS